MEDRSDFICRSACLWQFSNFASLETHTAKGSVYKLSSIGKALQQKQPKEFKRLLALPPQRTQTSFPQILRTGQARGFRDQLRQAAGALSQRWSGEPHAGTLRNSKPETPNRPHSPERWPADSCLYGSTVKSTPALRGLSGSPSRRCRSTFLRR